MAFAGAIPPREMPAPVDRLRHDGGLIWSCHESRPSGRTPLIADPNRR
jgi:hypothetical protein